MKAKTILLAGAVALVIVGCVIAAGCTSTTTTPSVSDDILVGVWTFTDDNGVHTIVMKNDGTGFITTTAKDDETRILKYSKLTWTKNADGTITHTLEKETLPITLTYNAEKETLLDNLQHTLTKKEPIAGIWFREGVDTISEKSAKVTHVIETDGTANIYVDFDDGTTSNAELTWVKKADGTYTLSYPNGVDVDWTLDKTGMNASASIDKDTRYTHTKVTDPSYPLWSYMLGPWYNDVWSNKPLFFLNADGTYSMYRTNSDSQTMEEIGNGTWEILEPGKIVQHINKGTVPSTGEDLSGLDITWTYDSVNNTFNEEEHGLKQVRPSEDVGSHHVDKFD